MRRRKFIYTTVLTAVGISATGKCVTVPVNQSKVILARNAKMINSSLEINSDNISKVLDNAVQNLFASDSALSAWKKIVKPGEVIGIKTNCLSGRGVTNRALVEAVTERLKEAGIRNKDIIIWDRYNMDLEDAGFHIRTNGNGPLCFGNDHAGFEYNLEVFGSAGSRVTKIMTQLCDGIINLPVLKDHSIAGVTIALKNMFGAIHNPNKYHLNTGNPYIADVNALPSVRNKIRLHICDAIEGQYQGGPSFMPQWRWPFDGLIVSRDPVALDTIGWQIIEKKRKEMGLPTLKIEGRQPVYIQTASDSGHNLGISNVDKIDMIEI